MSERIAGSYRDPSGYVFQRDGKIFRAIDAKCSEALSRYRIDTAVQVPGMVNTSFVNDPGLLETLKDENSPYTEFLEHARIRHLSFPYEWTFSMLVDAGLHTLDLQRQLIEKGCSLKDATPYNVQFQHTSTTFIDVASIEIPARHDIWFAMGQFMQMFLYPAMLFRSRGWDLRSYFLGNLSGRNIEQMSANIGRLGLWRPRVMLDVSIPLLLNRWSENRSVAEAKSAAVAEQSSTESAATKGGNSDAQRVTLSRLQRKLEKLRNGFNPRGAWHDYAQACTYDDKATMAKKELIKRFLMSTNPTTVLDVGCNTGQYSLLAAECGADVLAIDSDHDAVDVLYRELRDTDAAITPMVVDICNPSPSIGFLNQERESFLQRVSADCVFALALMHHLLVSANLPLTHIRDLMASLTQRDLIIEFVPRDDAMFQKLMRHRVELFSDLTLESTKAVFQSRFELLSEEPIPYSKRTLLMFRKKT